MQTPSMITLQQRSRRLSADLETPISLFLSLTQNKIPGLLLESAEVDGRWGRYSIIACPASSTRISSFLPPSTAVFT